MSDVDDRMKRVALLEQFISHTTLVGLATLALIRHGEYDLAEELKNNFQPICDWFNTGFRAMQERENESKES
jgi:hypothetical protein